MKNKTFKCGVRSAACGVGMAPHPVPPSRRMPAFRRTSAVPAENNTRSRRMAAFRRTSAVPAEKSTRSRRGTAAPLRKCGAVQMEYVILAVLIAAASVMAVVVFGRAVVSSFLTASEAATLDHTKARDEHHQRQQDRASEAGTSKQYHDSMHQ